MADRSSGYILPPPLSSSDDDDDNNLDLCDETESLWDRKLREVCKKTPEEKEVEIDCVGSSQSNTIVLDGEDVFPLKTSNKCSSTDTVSSTSHKSDVEKRGSCHLINNRDISVTKEKTENVNEVIQISGSSDVESDGVQIQDSEESQDKKTKTYKPISGGKWRKRPVPKTAIVPNQNNADDTLYSLSSSYSCNLSKGITCSEDVDGFLEDYIESDEEENNQAKCSDNDDKILINNLDQPSTSTSKNEHNTDIDLNFREVLLRKRSKSSERKRKHSLVLERLNKEQAANESAAKQKIINIEHVYDEINQGTSASTSPTDTNPQLSWKQKTRAENAVVSQTENTNVLDGSQKVSVKSPLKRAATFSDDVEAILEDEISSIKKCKSSNTISQPDESRVQHQKSTKTMPSKLNIVPVSQDEINKVMEIFPDADTDDIISRIKMLKSEFNSENILELVIDDMFSSPFTKEVKSPLVISPSIRSSVGEEQDILQALSENVIRRTAESESSIGSVGNSSNDKSHGKLSKSALFSRKGKIPLKKNNPGSSTWMDSPGTSNSNQDMDMTESELDISNEITVNEVSSPPQLFTCESCKNESIDDKVVQCGNCHIICNTCLEKQVKSVLSPDSKEVLITCCVDGCVGIVPNSQAKRVLPPIILELLEEKLDKEVLDSVKNMGDSLICPMCSLPMTADPWLKEIECPNCKQKSCRFCKKAWNAVNHADCSTYSTQGVDTGISSTLDVPFYWSPMLENENKDYIAVIVEKDTPEFSHVYSLFRSSMGRTTVTSIRRIQNLRLWQKFNLTKKHMMDDFGSDKLNEKQLFHGTKYAAVDGICKECFDWRMSGENTGTAYGQGTYFAKNASYSNRYSTKTPAILPSQSPQQSSPFCNNSSSHIGVGQFTQAVDSNPLGFAGNQNDFSNKTNQQTGFTFGTTGASNQQQSGGAFSFGNQSNSNQPTGFNFGNQNNAVQQSGFTFGTTVISNQQQSGPMFGNPSANNNQQQSAGGFTFGNRSTSDYLGLPKSGFKAVNVTGHTAALLTKNQWFGGGFGPVTNQNIPGFTFFGPASSNSASNQKEIVTDFMQPNKKYMFVARVLVGRSCLGNSKIRKPPPDPDDSKKRPFNSCVDNVNSPSIFVIFDISQCYPEYIIEY